MLNFKVHYEKSVAMFRETQSNHYNCNTDDYINVVLTT